MSKVYNMPRVHNKRHGNFFGAIYVGRPTQFGNPYVIGRDGTREQVLEKYREWIYSQPQLIEAAKKKLKGKDLVCWCVQNSTDRMAPLVCHAQILIEIANS